MAEYRSAPEIRDVADEVVEEHHPLLEQRGPRIEWIMTRPSSPSGSVPDFKIRRITGVNAFLSGAMADDFLYQASPFAAVEVASLFWAVLVNGGGERGFVDHVVSHLVYDHDKDAWVVEGPRFGEFVGVLERHGFWRPGKDYGKFASVVAEQLSLLPEDDEEDTVEGPNGELVDAGTGEVLEPAGAQS